MKELSPYYESVDNGYRRLSYEEVVEGLQRDIEELNKTLDTAIEIMNKRQNEIERLNDLVHSLRESRLQEHQENIELQDRISKAIEYIESYMPNYDFDKTNLIKVLDILKGDDKE